MNPTPKTIKGLHVTLTSNYFHPNKLFSCTVSGSYPINASHHHRLQFEETVGSGRDIPEENLVCCFSCKMRHVFQKLWTLFQSA